MLEISWEGRDKNYEIFFVFSLLLISNILLFSQPSFPGEGTADNPYQLWTKEHLEELSDSLYIVLILKELYCKLLFIKNNIVRNHL